jgi:hypothetical protein
MKRVQELAGLRRQHIALVFVPRTDRIQNLDS